jgi:hypothetical protein
MTVTLKRSVDEALNKFTLIGGAGSEEFKEACAMTLLAWMCDKDWTDHPECAHKLVADTVIQANDHRETTPEMRAELVKLGVDGALDTWWVPSLVIAWAMAGEKGEEIRPYDRAVRMLAKIAEWKVDRAVLSGADLSGAVLSRADLSRADLSGADLSGADLSGADLRDAVLSDADLSGAVGTPGNGMPVGWKLSESGLWVREAAA